MPQIIVIEPDPESRTALERTLQAQGHAVLAVASLDEVQGNNGDSVPARPVKLHDIERKAIEEALRDNHGNRTHAARQLGISLRKLQYRLKEYNAANGN